MDLNKAQNSLKRDQLLDTDFKKDAQVTDVRS